METTYSNSAKAVQNSASSGLNTLLRFFLIPFRSGLLGFSTFFSILLVTKLLGFLLGTREVFNIDMEDLLLSMVGFILVFLIRLLENFKEK